MRLRKLITSISLFLRRNSLDRLSNRKNSSKLRQKSCKDWLDIDSIAIQINKTRNYCFYFNYYLLR